MTGRPEYQPLQYWYKSVQPGELAALYRIADALLVTSIRYTSHYLNAWMVPFIVPVVKKLISLLSLRVFSREHIVPDIL